MTLIAPERGYDPDNIYMVYSICDTGTYISFGRINHTLQKTALIDIRSYIFYEYSTNLIKECPLTDEEYVMFNDEMDLELIFELSEDEINQNIILESI